MAIAFMYVVVGSLLLLGLSGQVLIIIIAIDYVIYLMVTPTYDV